MNIDRRMQRYCLEYLKSIYPKTIEPDLIGEFLSTSYDERCKRDAQLFYLAEQNLVELKYTNKVGYQTPRIIDVKITARGIDFLEEDGGLSAILGTVTVRLHADSIRDLIESRIVQSDELNDEQKKSMLDQLRSMREEGLKALTHRLINEGLTRMPNLWGTLSEHLA